MDLMEEDVWFNQVEDILSNNGLSIDTQDDGWYFLHGEGYSPANAIKFMLAELN